MNFELETEQRQHARKNKQFSEEIINRLHREGVFDIWLPEEYGGIDLNLVDGLKLLQKLAYCEASLGWIVTLCSGANFFLRHLPKRAAIQLSGHSRMILGGSGAVAGRAERLQNGHFILSGTWPYATAAPHLSHFTLSAPLYQEGKEVRGAEGKPMILSFVVPAEVVSVHSDWDASGMQATATHSFSVEAYECAPNFSFQYERVVTPNVLTALPFSTFADLTLLVCYLGVVEKMVFLVSARGRLVADLEKRLSGVMHEFYTAAAMLGAGAHPAGFWADFHAHCIGWLQQLGGLMYDAYRHAGLSSTTQYSEVHWQMVDFLTMSQHAHFRS